MTTGKVRASYVNIFQPRIPENGGEPKYSVTLLIPKTDAATLNAIFAEIEKAKQEGVQKFNGNIPPMCKIPIYDGDGYRPSGEAFGEECRGHMVMTASAKNQPVIVDLNMQNIINPADIYSGCFIRASINFFAYNSNGNKGIGCGLNAVQKIEDGEPLVMRISAEEAFGGSNAYTGAPMQNAGTSYGGMPIQAAGTSYGGMPVQATGANIMPGLPGAGGQMQQIDPITGRPMLNGGVMGIV
ncbi:MAG: DUF2815 family protein [Lachnospiraceae bacterium]|nr:DUF2815 family protein [Lachnospiraceae bacterium]